LSLTFTILGCGSSPGVPRINGDWGNCDPQNPRNRRLRCSALVERIGPVGRTTVVIDTSPDFREQMLTARVAQVDAVLYTHPHADHIHGIDDLRQYAMTQQRKIPVHADTLTGERLKTAFGYCFETPPGGIYPPILELVAIEAGKAVRIEGEGGPIDFLPILQLHGPITSLGFRFGGDLECLSGGLFYSPDISALPDQSIALAAGLDVWVLDALQYRRHISHFSLAEALEWIERIAPRHAYLTHMHIPLDYETVRRETPSSVDPAFDGMTLEIS
jgi:phosphoribosyl 1,2-cyclic phosphate phosphodiesterase